MDILKRFQNVIVRDVVLLLYYLFKRRLLEVNVDRWIHLDTDFLCLNVKHLHVPVLRKYFLFIYVHP